MSGEAVTEVDADAAELRAEGGEDGEVGGLVVERVVATSVAQVGGAADEQIRWGGRSVNGASLIVVNRILFWLGFR